MTTSDVENVIRLLRDVKLTRKVESSLEERFDLRQELEPSLMLELQIQKFEEQKKIQIFSFFL